MDFTQSILQGTMVILPSHYVLNQKKAPPPAHAKGVAPEDKEKEITTPEAIRQRGFSQTTRVTTRARPKRRRIPAKLSVAAQGENIELALVRRGISMVSYGAV